MHVVKHDRFDHWTAERAVGSLPESPQGPQEFVKDVFASLYKLAPEVDPAATSAHKPIIEEMMAMREWSEFRQTTRLDEVASSLATLELTERLASKIPDEAELKKKTNRKTGEPYSTFDSDGLRRSVRVALQETTRAVEEQLDAVAAIAGKEAGTGGSAKPSDVLNLHARLRDGAMLRQIAKLAGRMRRLAIRKHRDRVKHGPDEIVDIETGRELTRLLPTELLQLRNPTMRKDFVRRYAEGQLLQYRMEGREAKGRGPVILCQDSSGSMKGEREIWAKALAFGLMEICRRERRIFTLITFGNSSQLKAWAFDHKANAAEVLDAVAFSFHGGTSFAEPLNAAMEALQTSKYDKADIVFLTDGCAALDTDFRANYRTALNRRQAKLYTVLIGADRADSLEAISDGVARISDLTQDAEALDLAFSL